MPYEVQERAIREIPALRNVHIFRPGYAIEYDFFAPTQLHHTMETKLVKGLIFCWSDQTAQLVMRRQRAIV